MKLTTPTRSLGVVGAGQLGRMMGEAASPLGVELHVMDPTPRAPASLVARTQHVGAFDDQSTMETLARSCDVLTFEIELADPDILATVEEQTDTPVHPAPATLRMIQDKLRQKNRLREHDLPVAPFRDTPDLDRLRGAVREFGFPLMLKARRGGYDGRGNILLESERDLEPAFEEMQGATMVEQYVPFDRELAVVTARGVDELKVYPVTETVHEQEILRTTTAPAPISETLNQRAREIARRVLELMTGRGVFAIEMFQHDDSLLINEIAPRPHNSGHWTIEGTACSQFEQHVRAVLGFPLGSTALRAPSVTTNILGDVDEPRPAVLRGANRILESPHAHLHWYGKQQVRPLRKMGHFTLTGSDPSQLRREARNLKEGLTFDP